MSDKRRRMADTSRPQHRFHVAPDKFNVRAVDIRLYFPARNGIIGVRPEPTDRHLSKDSMEESDD
ncbi:MAG: hypothetical protein DRQ42_07235 [Gammaproteobacteria bacterium]|nr:MAG: hypothetical protein DRQ42_07235 [Gammaproteobacteria bacterium]